MPSDVTSAPTGTLPLRRRLSFRLALATGVGAGAILLAGGIWNTRLQREQQTHLIRDSAARSAETILRSTREAMRRDEPEEVNLILEAIGAQDGIERIRIFDKHGRITTSTLPDEVATLVDKSAEQCFVCHRADEPLERLAGPDRVRTFRRDDGSRVLGIVTPIRNEPDCSTADCHAHPAEQQVLGVLDVQLSLGQVDDGLLASELQLGGSLLLTVGAVLVLAGWLTWRMVLQPVRRFTVAADGVAAGDLSTVVPVTSRDELGCLAESWNGMVARLRAARDELEGWSHALEQRVEEKTEQLESAHRNMLVVEKMASLGQLSATVAHEINNPLAGIGTYARLLRRRLERGESARGSAAGDGEPDAAQILQLIDTEAARCGGIVRNLLQFSRTTGSRFARQSLPPLLERCVLLVRHQAELQGVAIDLELADDLPPVECDASQVQQMVLALAINAVEAMPAGGTLTLGARRGADPGEVVLFVRDTGNGIAPEDQHRIFEPFFTTKLSGTGSGLGLPVVYGIVRRHGGRIEVDSRPGAGTTFTVTLPRAQPSRVEERAHEQVLAP
jgi:two-component system NtrC family sensor kinase